MQEKQMDRQENQKKQIRQTEGVQIGQLEGCAQLYHALLGELGKAEQQIGPVAAERILSEVSGQYAQQITTGLNAAIDGQRAEP